MGDVAIRAESLSKQYRIGGPQGRFKYKTIRESLVQAVQAPFQRAGSLLRGEAYGAAGLSETIWALDDVSFEVKEGEAVGIIGRNGAGKSTLLRILSRITEPTKGGVDLYGRVGSLLEVGTGFHPELTGRENVYLNGAVLGMKRVEIDRKFDEIVAFAEIEKFLDTPVKHYSSGMYVRLAFAVAAHLEPEILLVDEVLAVGDAAFQKKCLGKMGDVASEGRTVLFVSHNMTAVQHLCKRAVWLDGGVITAEGAAPQIVTDYLSSSLGKPDQMERTWDELSSAPGNDLVRIRRVYAHAESADVGKSLSTDQDITLGVEFWSIKPEQALTITWHMLTSDAMVAFSTSTAHDPSLREKRLAPGLYRASCRIPANLLNDDAYRLRLLVVRDQTQAILTMEDALTFGVLEPGQRRGAYFGKRPGAVAPFLTWELHRMEGDSSWM